MALRGLGLVACIYTHNTTLTHLQKTRLDQVHHSRCRNTPAGRQTRLSAPPRALLRLSPCCPSTQSGSPRPRGTASLDRVRSDFRPRIKGQQSSLTICVVLLTVHHLFLDPFCAHFSTCSSRCLRLSPSRPSYAAPPGSHQRRLWPALPTSHPEPIRPSFVGRLFDPPRLSTTSAPELTSSRQPCSTRPHHAPRPFTASPSNLWVALAEDPHPLQTVKLILPL